MPPKPRIIDTTGIDHPAVTYWAATVDSAIEGCLEAAEQPKRTEANTLSLFLRGCRDAIHKEPCFYRPLPDSKEHPSEVELAHTLFTLLASRSAIEVSLPILQAPPPSSSSLQKQDERSQTLRTHVPPHLDLLSLCFSGTSWLTSSRWASALYVVGVGFPLDAGVEGEMKSAVEDVCSKAQRLHKGIKHGMLREGMKDALSHLTAFYKLYTALARRCAEIQMGRLPCEEHVREEECMKLVEYTKFLYILSQSLTNLASTLQTGPPGPSAEDDALWAKQRADYLKHVIGFLRAGSECLGRGGVRGVGEVGVGRELQNWKAKEEEEEGGAGCCVVL